MPPAPLLIPDGAIKVPVPDTNQETDSTCGASALLAVCLYFQTGPKEERRVVQAMRMSLRDGSDPEDVRRGALHGGLTYHEVQPMSQQRLKQFLDVGKPVLVMLQAWADEPVNYADDWNDGHWVVAIGYDNTGFYFEDPSIARRRGFLSYEELAIRWHDVGKYGQHVPQYGIALWKPGTRRFPRKIRHADHIE